MHCINILHGHTGSVLCLQYDERVIITGSSDSTIRSAISAMMCIIETSLHSYITSEMQTGTCMLFFHTIQILHTSSCYLNVLCFLVCFAYFTLFL